MGSYSKSLVAASVAFAIASSGSVAFAQQSDEKGAAFQLEEVIVTARKREERIQDVPGAVAIFSAEALEKNNVLSVDELSKFTTGLTFDTDFGRLSDRPILRGQSTILGDSGVSYFIDEIYYSGSLLDFNLEDVQSIQVVKGPQSALHGRNTYSGAILITTRAPTEAFTASVKAEVAEFGQGKYSAALAGPILGETLSATLSGSYYKRDGVTGDLWRNAFTGKAMGDQESKNANFGLYFQPNDRFDLRARVYWSEQQDGAPPLFLQPYTENNVFTDNGSGRPTVLGATFAPVAAGAGSVYLGAKRYYQGEIKARQISTDSARSLGSEPEIAGNRLLYGATANFKFTDNLVATYVGGVTEEKSYEAYDFDYQATSYGAFMTSSVGLRPRAGSPGVYEYAVSTGAPAANFGALSASTEHSQSHELRLRFDREKWDLMVGGYYFKSSTNNIAKQTPVAGWGAMAAESLGVLRARMQTACSTLFASTCTSVVRRTSAANATILPFDSTAGMWTTFEDTTTHGALKNRAFFGSVTFKPREDLELGLEARSAKETIERLPGQQNTLAYLTSGAELTPFSQRAAILAQSADFDSFTPRFTARFDLTPENNLYFVAANGTKPGGLNSFRAIAIGLGSFDEEKAWSFELGSKNTFADGRLMINAAMFANRIKDYQLTDSVVYADGTPSTLVKNVGKVDIQGLELELAYAPAAVEGLSLRLNTSFTDTEIKEGLDLNEGVLQDVADDNQLNCSRGYSPSNAALVASIRAANPNILPTTVICHNFDGTQYFGAYGDIAGRKLPRVPEYNVNVGADYARPIGSNWVMTASGNVSFEAKKYVQVDNLAYYGEATLVNANIGFANDNFSVVLWGKNLTDDDSVVSVSRFTDATNQQLRGFFGFNRLPRQFGISASYKFR